MTGDPEEGPRPFFGDPHDTSPRAVDRARRGRAPAPPDGPDDAGHGQLPGRDWYGSDRFLDRWWPLAIGAWEGARRARVVASGSDASDL